MSRRVRTVFWRTASGGYARSGWEPPCDVYSSGQGWLVKLELAGVRPEDVQIAVRGRELTVAGLRRDWSILEGQRSHSMEIAYDRFERVIEMPCDLQAATVRVEYRDGMFLILVLPPDRERP